ncbi:hypothetical protein tb265_05610 [Gemmatimonadetes bacterium T265]|nr:hypothetical protein tb265_05610 [Gemmatimonadetes bacterium T265]
MRYFPSIAAVLTLAACGRSATEPARVASPLVGSWDAAPVALRPTGTTSQSLSFGVSGRFQFSTSTSDAYAGQPAGLSARVRVTGTYRASADGAVAFAADSVVTWDRLSDGGREVVRTPYPYTPGPFDGARFAITGQQLTLRYTTYPADGPVATTLTLARVRAD